MKAPFHLVTLATATLALSSCGAKSSQDISNPASQQTPFAQALHQLVLSELRWTRTIEPVRKELKERAAIMKRKEAGEPVVLRAFADLLEPSRSAVNRLKLDMWREFPDGLTHEEQAMLTAYREGFFEKAQLLVEEVERWQSLHLAYVDPLSPASEGNSDQYPNPFRTTHATSPIQKAIQDLAAVHQKLPAAAKKTEATAERCLKLIPLDQFNAMAAEIGKALDLEFATSNPSK